MRFLALAAVPFVLTVSACAVDSVSAEQQAGAIPAGAADVATRLPDS